MYKGQFFDEWENFKEALHDANENRKVYKKKPVQNKTQYKNLFTLIKRYFYERMYA